MWHQSEKCTFQIGSNINLFVRIIFWRHPREKKGAKTKQARDWSKHHVVKLWLAKGYHMTKGDFGFRVKPTIDIAILWREILHVSKYIWYCIKRRVISNPILLPICNQARWTKTYLAVQMITGVIKKPMAILFSNLKYISTKVIREFKPVYRLFSRNILLFVRQWHYRNRNYAVPPIKRPHSSVYSHRYVSGVRRCSLKPSLYCFSPSWEKPEGQSG